MKNRLVTKKEWKDFCDWSQKLRQRMLTDGFTNDEIDKIFY